MRNASYLKFCTFLYQKQQKHDIKNTQKTKKKHKNLKTCFLNFNKKHKTFFSSMLVSVDVAIGNSSSTIAG